MNQPFSGSLFVIEAPTFSAGLFIFEQRVTSASPLVHFMQGWPEERVRIYCTEKGYTLRPMPIIDLRYGRGDP